MTHFRHKAQPTPPWSVPDLSKGWRALGASRQPTGWNAHCRQRWCRGCLGPAVCCSGSPAPLLWRPNTASVDRVCSNRCSDHRPYTNTLAVVSQDHGRSGGQRGLTPQVCLYPKYYPYTASSYNFMNVSRALDIVALVCPAWLAAAVVGFQMRNIHATRQIKPLKQRSFGLLISADNAQRLGELL